MNTPLTQKRICLAGDGWGAIAAFDALARSYEEIQVVTGDADLIARMRTSDIHIADISFARSDIVVCAGYKAIIPLNDLNRIPHINVHYSLLPKYRGMHSTVWAILNGEKYCGCTVHLMNEYIDDGPILAQFKTEIARKTSAEIMRECNQWVANNLDQVVASYAEGRILPVAQEKSQATWVAKRNLTDCIVNFDSTSTEIGRILQALVKPYPLPRFSYQSVVYEIVSAEVIYRPYICTNGRVVNIDNEGMWIKISDGLLLVKELLRDGKTVSLSHFKIGARLN